MKGLRVLRLLCFSREKTWEQDQWSYVFSNFLVSDIWERGAVDDDFKIYQPTIPVQCADELPRDRPLVLMAHPEGRYFQGIESLINFEHPDNAIYFFGASHLNVSDEDFGDRLPDYSVYIPTKLEMYSHVAAAVTLYDRLVKRGPLAKRLPAGRT
jgi:hypothetical protein